MSYSNSIPMDDSIKKRANELFRNDLDSISRKISWLLAGLLGLQWLMAVLLAVLISPYTWAGAQRSVHPHVWAAIILGGIVISTPILLAWRIPAARSTKHSVAIGQMVIGMVLIHIFGGRIETHFHVFVSLAFLSTYRDWKVLLTATVAVAADHIVRGYWWPMSVYGVADGAEWRWVEHASWVVFEDAFLILGIQQGLKELKAISTREARLERTNEIVEQAVQLRTAQLTERTNQLRSSEERLKAVYDTTVDGIITIDERGSIESLNPAVRELFGYAPDELIGKNINILMPEPDKSSHDGYLQDYLRTRKSKIIGAKREVLAIRRDGSEIAIELSISDSRIGDHRVFIGVLRDITSRKANENALRASEERYRLLFEANPHPMWVHDLDSQSFLAANDAALQHYGYTRSELLAKKLDAIDAGEDLGSQVTPFDPPPNVTIVRRHRLQSGEIRNVEVAANPIQFLGRPACLVLAMDVTERKRLEEQLKQSQKLESIGQLAAGIAHEINTPIQYIGDNTTFLKDIVCDLGKALSNYRNASTDTALLKTAQEQVDAMDLEYLMDEAPRAIDQTLEGVRHVANIVKAMKEFAHPGTNEKSPVDLNHTLSTVITVARNEWKYVAEVVTDWDDQLPPVPGLPGELNQVFLNLLVNAAHAIGSGQIVDGTKGKITIATRRIDRAVEVRITDTGCGIPETIRDRVFDPFFTTKPVGQGTGQGLAIAHNVVVNRHGGQIGLESEIGKGTIFWVRLPLDEIQPAAIQPPRAVAARLSPDVMSVTP